MEENKNIEMWAEMPSFVYRDGTIAEIESGKNLNSQRACFVGSIAIK